MKNTKKVNKLDRYKFETGNYCFDYGKLDCYEYWGFYPKNGKLYIDTKRYKIACKEVGIKDFLPKDLFKQRNTTYYEPSRRKRYDYKINIFRDLIRNLKDDWSQEYKPLFNKIKTPKDIEENYRLNKLAYTLSSDDYDEICIDAQIAGIKREHKYQHIIQSLYCQFIQKIAAEVDRYTLIVMEKCGWKGNDFTFKNFVAFSYGLRKNKDKIRINSLSKYNAYNMLRKINNFLKHNSLAAYQKLKKLYPENVASLENKKTQYPYKNGMFAGDWIIVKPNYIDDLLEKLIIFFEDYCRLYLDEDIERSNWDYDDYFYNAKKEMQYPEEYFGFY